MQRQIAVFLICAVLLFVLTGCGDKYTPDDFKENFTAAPSTESVRESIPYLSIATLKSLIDICGDDLAWDTFTPYWHILSEDPGFGLYILNCPIDEDYSLIISGTST